MLISILLPDLRGGGAERVMLDLAVEFSNLGHEVEFVLMQASGDFLTEAESRFAVFDLEARRARNVPFALSRYLNSRKPHALVANMWPLTVASVIGKCFSHYKCHLLLVEHNTLSQQYSGWGVLHSLMLSASTVLTYRFADSVAAVSEGAAKDTASLAWLVSDRVKVLPNPIPQKVMPSSEDCAFANALWDCPPGQRILTVGSLKEQKNHSLLLKSFADMRSHEARLMLVGQGELEVALRAQATELGISDRVIFAGFHHNPSVFYATADLFVLSSDYEGFGNVIVEALSFGVPVVSTDCPFGPAEILQGDRFGRLVPVRDILALTCALDAMLEAPVDRSALVHRAASFAPEIAAHNYLALLGLT